MKRKKETVIFVLELCNVAGYWIVGLLLFGVAVTSSVDEKARYLNVLYPTTFVVLILVIITHILKKGYQRPVYVGTEKVRGVLINAGNLIMKILLFISLSRGLRIVVNLQISEMVNVLDGLIGPVMGMMVLCMVLKIIKRNQNHD